LKTFYSHGKLLLSAEYFVLDGAKALAVPTKKGQKLSISATETPGLHWKSILADGTVWFETKFDIDILKTQSYQNEDPILQRLGDILMAALRQQPNFLNASEGIQAISQLEFPRDWGLGSSSTLLNNIAQWAQINPYKLLSDTFGGSGYDIACAKANTPITYLRTKTDPIVETNSFCPSFRQQIFFIHLNQKQNSRDSIAQYRAIQKNHIDDLLKQVNVYTDQMIQAITLDEFASTIHNHESFLADILQTPTVKARLFSSYHGAIKSLGGWGGDFVMATGTLENMAYFKERGYETILSYDDMVL
jgi:mevalonate kinase